MIEKFKTIQELNGQFPDYILDKLEKEYIIIRNCTNPNKRKYAHITNVEHNTLINLHVRRHIPLTIKEQDLDENFMDVDNIFLNKTLPLGICLWLEYGKEWFADMIYTSYIPQNELPKPFTDIEENIDLNNCQGVFYEDFNHKTELLCIVAYNKENNTFLYYDEYLSNVIKHIEGITFSELYNNEIKNSIDRILNPLTKYKQHIQNFVQKINNITDFDNMRTFQDENTLSATFIIGNAVINLITHLNKSTRVELNILHNDFSERLNKVIEAFDEWNY